MAMARKLVACGLAGVVVLAFFTKPNEAAHQSKVVQVIGELQSEQVRNGAWLAWIALKGVDAVRPGRFESGVFTSNYQVMVAGRIVATCTGMFDTVACSCSA